MGYSVVTKVGTGATNQFSVDFALGYFSLDDLKCRVGTEVDGLGGPVYRTITVISASVFQISGAAPGLGVPVVFTRTIDPTMLKVDWQDDAQIDETNLNNAQLQALYLIHQFLDGRFASFAQDIDMGGFRVINMADPVNAQDAVTKSWLLAQPGNNIQAAIDAANAASASATAANNSAIAAAAAVAGVPAMIAGKLDTSVYNTFLATLGGAQTRAVGTASEYWVGTSNKLMGIDQIWAAAVPVTKAFSSTLTYDLSTGINFATTVTSNFTLANFTNPKLGQSGSISLTNSGSGWVMSLGSNFRWANGTAGVLDTTAGALNKLFYFQEASNITVLSLSKKVS